MNNVFLKSLKWSFLSQIAPKLITPIVFLAMVNILSPDDFGVMTAALIVISFSQIFWESGVSQAVINTKISLNKSASVGFWINMLICTFISILILISSNFIAEVLFNDIRVSLVLQVMILHIFFSALGSVNLAILKRELKFKKIFKIQLYTNLIPAIFSLPIAIYGYGYWALVIGSIVGQVSQTILLFKLSEFYPIIYFSKKIAKSLLKFSVWVTFSALLVWFYAWTDSFFIGNYYGTNTLGVFRAGNQFIAVIFTLCFAPVGQVLFPYLSNFTKKSDYSKIITTVQKCIIYFSLSITFFIFFNKEVISEIIFDEEYLNIYLVVGFMALVHGYSWIVGINGEVYKAINNPKVDTYVSSGLMLLFLVVYYLTINLGLETFLLSRFSLSILALILHVYVLNKYINIDLISIVKPILLISIVALILNLLKFYISDFTTITFSGLIVTILYTIITLSYFIKNESRMINEVDFLKKIFQFFKKITLSVQGRYTSLISNLLLKINYNKNTFIIEKFDFEAFKTDTKSFIYKLQDKNNPYEFKFAKESEKNTLYGSAYSCITLGFFDEIKKLSIQQKKEWKKYFDDFQNPEDGLFYDTNLLCEDYDKLNWWGKLHLSVHVFSAYNSLGLKPRFEINYIKNNKIHDLIDAIDKLDWSSYNIAKTDIDNKIMNIGALILFQREFFSDKKAEKDIGLIRNYLKDKFNVEKGVWGDYNNKKELSRIVQFSYHLLLLFSYDKIIPKEFSKLAYCALKTQNKFGGFGIKLNSSACEDMDSLEIIYRLRSIVKKSDKKLFDTAMKKAFNWIMNNRVNDKGFVFRLHEKLEYGHIHTTSMANCGAIFPTWFRTLSIIYILEYFNSNKYFKIKKTPGYEFI